jgi:hypothetical protein
VKISLPPQINAGGFIPFLSLLGRPLNDGEDVVLDFSELRRVTPAGPSILKERPKKNHSFASSCEARARQKVS